MEDRKKQQQRQRDRVETQKMLWGKTKRDPQRAVGMQGDTEKLTGRDMEQKRQREKTDQLTETASDRMRQKQSNSPLIVSIQLTK